MSNAIVTLISVAIVLAGVTLMAQGSFKSMDTLSDAWKQMEVRAGEVARTALQVVDTEHQANSPLVDITLRNSGQTPLRDFAAWDVIVEYYQKNGSYHQRWLPYTQLGDPPNNRWTVTGIYLDAAAGTPEKFQPNILDPGEEMVIRMRLFPKPSNEEEHQALIGTLNGVTVSTIF